MIKGKSLKLIRQRTGLDSRGHYILLTRNRVSDTDRVSSSAVQRLSGIVADQNRFAVFRQIGLFRFRPVLPVPPVRTASLDGLFH